MRAPASGSAACRFPGGLPFAAAYSDDGRRLAIGAFDGTVSVWNPASGERLAVLGGHTGPVTDISFNARGDRLVTGERRHHREALGSGRQPPRRGLPRASRLGLDGGVRARRADGPDREPGRDGADLGRRRRERPSEEFNAGATPTSASFAADGGSVLTAAAAHVTLWDLATGSPRRVLPCHDAPSTMPTSAPTAALILTASEDGVARIWSRADDLEQSLPGSRAR